MRTNVDNIAVVAIIGVIGGQAVATAILSIILDATFGWESVLSLLLIRIVESAGAITGICLVGVRFVGFGAVRAAGGIGLTGAVLFAAFSLIIELTRYDGVSEPLAFLLMRPMVFFAILAASGAIAALAATAVAAILSAMRSTDMRTLDAKS